MIANMVLSWIVNHQQLLGGIALGILIAHWKQALKFAIHTIFVRFPKAKNWVRENIDKIDEVADELQKDLREEATSPDTEQPAPKPQPPTLPPSASALLLLGLLACAATANAAYFDTIASDPAHPKISAQVLYTSRLDLDGGVADAAIVYHKADPEDCLWPRAWQAAGIPPISWTLLEVGAGIDSKSGFLHFGASVDVAPTILGPLTSALRSKGGKAEAIGNLIESPDGNGVKLSLGWKGNVITDGGFTPLNEIRFPPRYGVGYTYKFK